MLSINAGSSSLSGRLRDVRTVKEQLEAKLTDLEDQLTEMQKALDRFQELRAGSPDQDALLKVSGEPRVDAAKNLWPGQAQRVTFLRLSSGAAGDP